MTNEKGHQLQWGMLSLALEQSTMLLETMSSPSAIHGTSVKWASWHEQPSYSHRSHKRKNMLTWICDRYKNIIFRNSYQHWKSFADTESSTSKLYSLHHLYLCQCVSQLKRWIGDLTDLIQADTSAVTERVRTWAEVRGENLGCKLTSYTSFGRCWLESTIIIHNW